jgi:hypothetical protein
MGFEAAKKRLHHSVLAIALANELARMPGAVLNKEHNLESCEGERDDISPCLGAATCSEPSKVWSGKAEVVER